MTDKDSTDEEILEVLLPVMDLRREVTKLRAVNKVLQLRGDTYLEQLQQKHAENERLRAALKHMVEVFGPLARMGAGEPAVEQAREALASDAARPGTAP